MGKNRKFVDENFEVTTWQDLKPWYESLETRPIHSAEDLEKLIFDLAELEAIVGDAFAWAYINMNRDTTDKKASEKFVYFVENLQPELTKYDFIMNKKIVHNDYFKALEEKGN